MPPYINLQKVDPFLCAECYHSQTKTTHPNAADLATSQFPEIAAQNLGTFCQPKIRFYVPRFKKPCLGPYYNLQY